MKSIQVLSECTVEPPQVLGKQQSVQGTASEFLSDEPKAWLGESGWRRPAMYSCVWPCKAFNRSFFLMNAEIDGQPVQAVWRSVVSDPPSLLQPHSHSECNLQLLPVSRRAAASLHSVETLQRRSRGEEEQRSRAESIHTGAEHPHLGWGWILPSVGGACQAAPGSAAVCCVCGSTWDAWCSTAASDLVEWPGSWRGEMRLI